MGKHVGSIILSIKWWGRCVHVFSVCIQRICINTSKYDNLIHTYTTVSRYFFCTIYVHPTAMTLHVHFYVYTYYSYTLYI